MTNYKTLFDESGVEYPSYVYNGKKVFVEVNFKTRSLTIKEVV